MNPAKPRFPKSVLFALLMLLVVLGKSAQYKLVLVNSAFPILAGHEQETDFKTRFGTSYTAEVEAGHLLWWDSFC